jgi:PTS system fructose-specific IIA component/PTS system nitrogen regulatory IIA component
MKFSDFICREAIRTNLAAREKKDVIRAMATSLLEAKKINEQDYESIVEAILKREELGSTGIGRGVAVPHTKHPSIDKLIGILGLRIPAGLDERYHLGDVIPAEERPVVFIGPFEHHSTNCRGGSPSRTSS